MLASLFGITETNPGAKVRVSNQPIEVGADAKPEVKTSNHFVEEGKGVQMAAGNEAHNLHSHPHLVLVSDEGETSRQGPHDPSTVFDSISKLKKGEVPCKQSTLSSIAGKASAEEGKIVHPIVSEVIESGEGLWRT